MSLPNRPEQTFSDRIAFFSSALLPPLLSVLKRKIGNLFGKIEAGEDVSDLIGPNERFAATASSVTLAAALNDDDVSALFGSICKSPARDWIVNALAAPPVCDISQSWIRRQYAPRHYPRLHAPHGWHQDGALGFDFLSYPDDNYPEDAILRMVTCWIALDSCGVDAPGLELITQKQTRLLPPAELSHGWIREQFPPDQFWRPRLEPGDALLFPGDVLHRTHVTPAMTRDRTSLELRFFGAKDFPARLKNSRLARL
jgi:ectoine hydroxylase-related dioxygenase (phytanoyl-CoA dioxygenase family)